MLKSCFIIFMVGTMVLWLWTCSWNVSSNFTKLVQKIEISYKKPFFNKNKITSFLKTGRTAKKCFKNKQLQYKSTP